MSCREPDISHFRLALPASYHTWQPAPELGGIDLVLRSIAVPAQLRDSGRATPRLTYRHRSTRYEQEICRMGNVVAGMTMSLDGFVADRDGNVARLYPDFAEMSESASMSEDARQTGAVIMGRRMFEMAAPGDWASYEFQVPIFVVTTHPPATPPEQAGRLTFSFIEDGVAPAVTRAKAAAGDKMVQVVGGSRLIQEMLRLDLVDELAIDIMPVLLGDGPRLFDGDGLDRVRLDLTEVDRLDQRIRLKLRVGREQERG